MPLESGNKIEKYTKWVRSRYIFSYSFRSKRNDKV